MSDYRKAHLWAAAETVTVLHECLHYGTPQTFTQRLLERFLRPGEAVSVADVADTREHLVKYGLGEILAAMQRPKEGVRDGANGH